MYCVFVKHANERFDLFYWRDAKCIKKEFCF